MYYLECRLFDDLNEFPQIKTYENRLDCQICSMLVQKRYMYI